MIFVQRRVSKYVIDSALHQKDKSCWLEELRSLAAWILLGEPGAGKSTAFRMEAQASEGICISIADFLRKTQIYSLFEI